MLEAQVYFWQKIVTPHMANLAEALAATGKEVIYVANESMSTDRQQMGWAAPVLNHAKLLTAADAQSVAEIARAAPAQSIHLCQGLRGNGLVSIAQQVLAKREVRQWTFMETIDDAGPLGEIKRLHYRWLLLRRKQALQGILAIGWETPGWLRARGVEQNTIFPFAYFLLDALAQVSRMRVAGAPFRFLFVGQLIECKRVDRLLQSLAAHVAHDFELVVVGDGPKRSEWEAMGHTLLPNRVRWLGRLPMDEIPQKMANADCLVLPSRHDGWGAVVSEALMVGTPVICSDACGSAGVVRASGVGGVFPKDNVGALSSLAEAMLAKGVLLDADRQELKGWASGLGAAAGARYLAEILEFSDSQAVRPMPPWGNGNKVQNQWPVT